jgi:hypothetical protein
VFVAVSVGLALAAIGALHVYWGIVGVSERSAALPEVNGKPVFTPPRAACFAVAGALVIASALVLWCGHVLRSPIPAQLVTVGTVGVGCVFLLRAIGDFRLVGFFKRVRGSPFAAWDTALFSPLSLALGVGSLWVALA